MKKDKKLEELIAESKKALTEIKVSREAKIWLVKLLRETDKGFTTGDFYDDECYCAYGVASDAVSNGTNTSPGLACSSAEGTKAGGYLNEFYSADFTSTNPGITLINDKCSRSHKETSAILQELWGLTEEEIAEFKL